MSSKSRSKRARLMQQQDTGGAENNDATAAAATSAGGGGEQSQTPATQAQPKTVRSSTSKSATPFSVAVENGKAMPKSPRVAVAPPSSTTMNGAAGGTLLRHNDVDTRTAPSDAKYDATAAVDHTLALAHHSFMSIFEMLPTRQWLELGYVSKHWRKMLLSFFRQHNNINLTELCREEPLTLLEWTRVQKALSIALTGKVLKPEYIEHLQPRAGGTKLLHLLLINDAVIMPLLANFTVLRVIDLSLCDGITDRTLLQMGDYSKQLERVILTRCSQITGIGVGYLLDHLPALRELNVAGCHKVDDELVDVDHEGERCLALQSVQLSWTNVSMAAVFILIAQCRDLKQLSYAFGRSPIYDTFITSHAPLRQDPPTHGDLDEYINVKNSTLLIDICEPVTDATAEWSLLPPSSIYPRATSMTRVKSVELELATTPVTPAAWRSASGLHRLSSNSLINPTQLQQQTQQSTTTTTEQQLPNKLSNGLRASPPTLTDLAAPTRRAKSDDATMAADPATTSSSTTTSTATTTTMLTAPIPSLIAATSMPTTSKRKLHARIPEPVFSGCLRCSNQFCTAVEDVPFQYGVCAGCKSAMYCSKQCQGVAWHFGHGVVCRLQRNIETTTNIEHDPMIARGMAKSASLRLLDASGNRSLADIILGAMLIRVDLTKAAIRYYNARSKRASNGKSTNNTDTNTSNASNNNNSSNNDATKRRQTKSAANGIFNNATNTTAANDDDDDNNNNDDDDNDVEGADPLERFVEFGHVEYADDEILELVDDDDLITSLLDDPVEAFLAGGATGTAGNNNTVDPHERANSYRVLNNSISKRQRERALRTMEQRRHAQLRQGNRERRARSSGVALASSPARPIPKPQLHLLNIFDDEDGNDTLVRKSFLFSTPAQRRVWLSDMLPAASVDEAMSLRCICLSKCAITDERLAVLTPLLPSITHLDLEKSCLTDVGVRTISSSCSSLRHLQITGSQLTLKTVPILCESQKLRQNLRSVLIGGTNSMTRTEAYLAVGHFTALERMYVWSQFNEEECRELQATVDSRQRPQPLLVLARARFGEPD